MKKLVSLVFTMFLVVATFAQQTTSSFSGKVIDGDNAPLIGAVVEIVHVPTGSSYLAATNNQGMYRIANVQPGGPYTVKVSYIGYNSVEDRDVFVNLGQTRSVTHAMKEQSQGIDAIVISANKSNTFDGNKMGTQTVVNADKISVLPNAGRTMSDFVRLTPQAKISPSGSITVAGQNNRYNSFTVDGTLQNDAYGLAGNGTNSGQIGFTPFSVETIDQFTVELSPYDVTQGGFAGAGISAVTKSGTNDFRVSAYEFFRNEKLAGKTPTDDKDKERKRLDKFTSNTYGVSVGGPIVKDKLFFYFNGELQQDNAPITFNVNDYINAGTAANRASQAEIDALEGKLLKDYGYNAGSYGNTAKELKGGRAFFKLDWNINQNNKFTIRYNYTRAKSTSPSRSSEKALNFANGGQSWLSTVSSVAAELKSKINDQTSNYLYIGYNSVSDDRDPMGANFPSVKITDKNIYFGSERYSSANALTQKVFTLTDNLAYSAGNHNITLGTHNEYYSMYNLFIGDSFGNYGFKTLNDFMTNKPATSYSRKYGKLDDIIGDGSISAAKFKVLQLGFYLQDEYQVNPKFKLTYGLRIDIPMFLTDTPNNEHFNNTVVPELEKAWGDVFTDAGSPTFGSHIKAKIYWSPRAGFNWDINGDKTQQLRGGVGLFTSRIPYVWPGGSYSNNGMTTGAFNEKTSGFDPAWLSFNPRWDNQPSLPAGAPSGQIDIFAKNFKFPQVLRANIGYDVKLPGGITGIFDAIYTKNISNVYYRDLQYIKSDKTLTGTGDDRNIWEKLPKATYPESNKYTGIYLATNTSKGYSYTLSASFEKYFRFGLSAFAGYSFNRSMSINEGGSSQNNSQLLNSNIYGLNEPTLKRSVYDAGSRVIANISYRANYSKYASTIVSLFYTGQYGGGTYGSCYGYGYSNASNSGILGDYNNGQTAIYVPKNEKDINFKDGDPKGEQWKALNDLIEGDSYLSTRRGQYAEPNQSRTPWENIFDLKIIQEFKLPQANGRIHKIQFSFDVYNLGNLLCKDWGRMYYGTGQSYNAFSVLKFEGYKENTKTPLFSLPNAKDGVINKAYSIDDGSSLQSSRWQAQIGIKYLF